MFSHTGNKVFPGANRQTKLLSYLSSWLNFAYWEKIPFWINIIAYFVDKFKIKTESDKTIVSYRDHIKMKNYYIWNCENLFNQLYNSMGVEGFCIWFAVYFGMIMPARSQLHSDICSRSSACSRCLTFPERTYNRTVTPCNLLNTLHRQAKIYWLNTFNFLD